MSDIGDEADSRTASVGQQRPRSARSSTRSSRDGDSRPAKRRRRNRSRAEDMKDIVPRGASFSATPLEVDPAEDSSSDAKSSSDFEKSEESEPENAARANPHVGSTVPAISWNQGRKSAIRTTLGKRKTIDDSAPRPPPSQPKSASEPDIIPSKNAPSSSASLPSTTATKTTKPKQFAAVNAYWKSQDESASSEHSEDEDRSESEDSSDLEEGEVNSDSDDMESDPDTPGPDNESESDSDSAGSDLDDSLLLNIGSKSDDGNEDHSDHELMANGITNGDTKNTPGSSSVPFQRSTETKEQAFQSFTEKYPVAPTVLADLAEEDLKRQVDYWYWFRKVTPADYGTLPPGCFECLKRGHMSDVCPDKECPHCGKWGEHTAFWCPVWLRCEKCRERGHCEAECTSRLRCSAEEVPCEICGGTDHVERTCLRRIQLPMYEPDTITGSNQFRISISCSHCLSNSHIIGDCPNRVQTQETAWISLRGISPSRIININTATGPEPPRPINYQEGRGRPQGRRGGLNVRSDSSSDNDVLPLRAASNRNPPRGNPPPPPRNTRGRGRAAANAPPPRGRGRGAARGAAQGFGGPGGPGGSGRGRGNGRGGRGGPPGGRGRGAPRGGPRGGRRGN
ncbi:hypothetical protein N7493_004042 [Penicillium malachiteum]|uniref:CCHC-type domain-containing protein n=1 Tax=Penicillium malachiteum TaxID=1324776 RepID=A0AAD6MY82_9EURO|nr:hypothetical protein N7493_004042 [Penicillium malachiteum]